MPLPCASDSGEHYRTTGNVITCPKIPPGPFILGALTLGEMGISGAGRSLDAGDMPPWQALTNKGFVKGHVSEFGRGGDKGSHRCGFDLCQSCPRFRHCATKTVSSKSGTSKPHSVRIPVIL